MTSEKFTLSNLRLIGFTVFAVFLQTSYGRESDEVHELLAVETLSTTAIHGETYIRKFNPNLPVEPEKVGYLSLRSRRIQGTERYEYPVLMFGLPEEILSKEPQMVTLSLTPLSSSSNDCKIRLYATVAEENDNYNDLAGISYSNRVDLRDSERNEWRLLDEITYKSGRTDRLVFQSERLKSFIHQNSGRSVTLIVLPDEVEPGVDFSLRLATKYLGNADAPSLELLFGSLAYSAGESFRVPLASRTDLETGAVITQLSALPGLNQSFYYHKFGMTKQNDAVVYRNIRQDPSSNAIYTQYFKVDPDTGITVALTNAGHVSGADLFGRFLYYYEQDVDESSYTLTRTNIDTHETEAIFTTDWNPAGSVTMNADGRYALLLLENPETAANRQGLWDENRDRKLLAFDVTERTHQTIFRENVWYAHVMASPEDPDLFLFIDQRAKYRNPKEEADGFSHLPRICMGSISKAAWGPLTTNNAFVKSFGNFPHPWWGSDGKVWSDSLWNPENAMGLFSFVPGAAPDGPYPANWPLKAFDYYPISMDQWQHHHNRTQAKGWFIGDGAWPSAHGGRGSPYIHLFKPDRSISEISYYRVAKNFWNSSVRIAGYRGPNAQMRPDSSGIVYQDLIDFENYSMRILNVFLVTLPDDLKNKVAP